MYLPPQNALGPLELRTGKNLEVNRGYKELALRPPAKASSPARLAPCHSRPIESSLGLGKRQQSALPP